MLPPGFRKKLSGIQEENEDNEMEANVELDREVPKAISQLEVERSESRLAEPEQQQVDVNSELNESPNNGLLQTAVIQVKKRMSDIAMQKIF